VVNPNGLTGTMRNEWFEQRRNFFVRQLIDEFFRLNRSFQAIYLIYLDCRNPGGGSCADLLEQKTAACRSEIWDRLAHMVGTDSRKGPLWKLKDLCHAVWPEGDNTQDVSGSMFDWLVGSIFHETMMLKENIYLLNRYGPAAFRLKDRPLELVPMPRSGTRMTLHLESIIDVHNLLSRAAADAVRQVEQIAFLFNHASYILRLMMPDLAGNSLVVRLLTEEEELVRMLWGEELADIFTDMYAGDAAEGFCVAGGSYLGGHWFVRALKMYQRALAVNPTCDEAITRMVQLQAVVRANRDLLDTAAMRG
jgi:hypothetical protein